MPLEPRPMGVVIFRHRQINLKFSCVPPPLALHMAQSVIAPRSSGSRQRAKTRPGKQEKYENTQQYPMPADNKNMVIRLHSNTFINHQNLHRFEETPQLKEAKPATISEITLSDPPDDWLREHPEILDYLSSFILYGYERIALTETYRNTMHIYAYYKLLPEAMKADIKNHLNEVDPNRTAQLFGLLENNAHKAKSNSTDFSHVKALMKFFGDIEIADGVPEKDLWYPWNYQHNPQKKHYKGTVFAEFNQSRSGHGLDNSEDTRSYCNGIKTGQGPNGDTKIPGNKILARQLKASRKIYDIFYSYLRLHYIQKYPPMVTARDIQNNDTTQKQLLPNIAQQTKGFITITEIRFDEWFPKTAKTNPLVLESGIQGKVTNETHYLLKLHQDKKEYIQKLPFTPHFQPSLGNLNLLWDTDGGVFGGHGDIWRDERFDIMSNDPKEAEKALLCRYLLDQAYTAMRKSGYVKHRYQFSYEDWTRVDKWVLPSLLKKLKANRRFDFKPNTDQHAWAFLRDPFITEYRSFSPIGHYPNDNTNMEFKNEVYKSVGGGNILTVDPHVIMEEWSDLVYTSLYHTLGEQEAAKVGLKCKKPRSNDSKPNVYKVADFDDINTTLLPDPNKFAKIPRLPDGGIDITSQMFRMYRYVYDNMVPISERSNYPDPKDILNRYPHLQDGTQPAGREQSKLNVLGTSTANQFSPTNNLQTPGAGNARSIRKTTVQNVQGWQKSWSVQLMSLSNKTEIEIQDIVGELSNKHPGYQFTYIKAGESYKIRCVGLAESNAKGSAKTYFRKQGYDGAFPVKPSPQ